MSRLMERLGPDADRLRWIFVSMDPALDTPERVAAAYLELGPTGALETLAATTQARPVYCRGVALETGGYTMDHAAPMCLMDAGGRAVSPRDRKEGERVAPEKPHDPIARG